jgi:hypothetical protein
MSLVFLVFASRLRTILATGTTSMFSLKVVLHLLFSQIICIISVYQKLIYTIKL